MGPTDIQYKVCQQEIGKLDLKIKGTIQDIQSCDSSMETLNNLNAIIRTKSKQLKNRILELENIAKQQDKEIDRISILKDVENHRRQLENTNNQTRTANLVCLNSLEENDKKTLLTGNLRQRTYTNKDDVANLSCSITSNLQRISQTMAMELEQSSLTSSTLLKSSQQINETNDEMKDMAGHLKISNKLLTKYSRREFTEKLLIMLALVFFFFVVLYIVKQRLF